jgi:hypothetical protein
MDCENEDRGCKLICCCGEPMERHRGEHQPVSLHWWYCEGNCNMPDAENAEWRQ